MSTGGDATAATFRHFPVWCIVPSRQVLSLVFKSPRVPSLLNDEEEKRCCLASINIIDANKQPW